jgi:hypothetical protein
MGDLIRLEQSEGNEQFHVLLEPCPVFGSSGWQITGKELNELG